MESQHVVGTCSTLKRVKQVEIQVFMVLFVLNSTLSIPSLLSYEMGVYCFKIIDHGAQHAVVTMYIISEADFVRIHASSSPNKCILPRSTHTYLESECENKTSDSTNVLQRHHSRQSRIHVQYPTTSCVYVRSSSLVIGTHSGCTTWCTSDNEFDYQWSSDCLPTPCINIVTSTANPCGACNYQRRP